MDNGNEPVAPQESESLLYDMLIERSDVGKSEPTRVVDASGDET